MGNTLRTAMTDRDAARAEVARRALPQLRKGVKIVAAKFGPDAGLVGAATFALQEPAGSKS